MQVERKIITGRLLLGFSFLLYPIFASVISLYFELNFLSSMLLFFAVPGLHLSVLYPQAIKRVVTFAAIATVPYILIIDYIGHLGEIWYVPSVFPFRVLGVVPIEDFVVGFCVIYLVVMFYEYFFDRFSHTAKPIVGKVRLLGIMISAGMGVFLVSLFFSPNYAAISPLYFLIGVIPFILMLLWELIRKPTLGGKLFFVGAYFLFFTLIQEITGLKLGWWTFPGGGVLGWITVLGVSFPIEEFFYWCLLGPITVISQFEFFFDDEK